MIDRAMLDTMLHLRAMVCAVCLYAPRRNSGGKANLAITVIEGYAVCEDCLGYVAQGMDFHNITESARRERDVS